jgi:hypothetical protein
MRESRTYGFVRGARGNSRPYRDGSICCTCSGPVKQAQKDSNRLHQLYCKRISPPSCGGGTLPDAVHQYTSRGTKRLGTNITVYPRIF